MKRVGIIVNSRVPSVNRLFQGGLLPHHLVTGWDDSASAMSVMRFHWIAGELTRAGLAHYELYRPWRAYDAVVFLKSMGTHCLELARSLQARGTKVIFEANVDYYSVPSGEAKLDAMAPTALQRSNAEAITRQADAVIASSRHLGEVCRQFASEVHWVPDNVDLRHVPWRTPNQPKDRLPIWWSGMAAKLFEFLAVEEAWLSLADRLHFHFVTNSLKALDKWPSELRRQFDQFLGRVSHTFHDFTSVPALMHVYSQAEGVIVSPRYLDTPYNLGHTEWKLTLGLACGLPALASPVPSYEDVADRAGEGAIQLCTDDASWRTSLVDALEGRWDLGTGALAAREVVEKHYSTQVVARQHWQAVQSVLA